MKKFILIVIGVLSFCGIAYADLITTPTAIQAGDQTVLHTYITGTATSITLEPVIKYINAVKTKGCVDTQAGFATIQDTSRTEWISYSSTSCSSAFITTLSGVRRGLSPTSVSFAAGTGMSWDAGSVFKVIDYPIMFNYTIYKDAATSMTGSGSIRCTATNQPCLFTAGVTTTQRNAFTYGTAAGLYPDIFNTTTGVKEYWNGSSWIKYGSGSTVNASDSVAGKVQILPYSQLISRTATGSSGAQNVLSPRYLVKTGTGTVSSGYIPQLNQNGLVGITLGGSGTGSQAGIASGAILVYQKTNAPRALYATSANQFIVSTDGKNWNPSTLTQPPTTVSGSAVVNAYTKDGVSTGSLVKLTIAANNPSVGTEYILNVSGTGSANNGGSGNFWLDMGTSAVPSSSSHTSVFVPTNNSAVWPWSLKVEITFFTIGASAEYGVHYTMEGLGTSTDAVTVVKTLNSTNPFVIRLQYNNGGNAAEAKTFPLILQKIN